MPAGRPRTKIDLEKLEQLCAIGCTQPEIAAVFGVSLPTIERRARQPRFREAMDRGYLKGKVSLRRKQMQLAQEGNPTMLVWLGKQWLGQADQLNHNIQDPGGKTIIQVVYVDKAVVLPSAPPRGLLPEGEGQ